MKRKILRVTGFIFLFIILGIASILAYVKFGMPSVGDAPEMTIEPTPERIERGKYLANHVMVCMDCHAERDWTKFSAPPIAGTEGKGGEVFDQHMGFPGKFISRNITPTNLERYTDGELFRVITTGVTKEGEALFPIMPYGNYGQCDEEDIKSVIAYVRTLKPIDNVPEKSSPDFPMNFILNTMPQKASLQTKPDPSDQVAYGKYMVTASGCQLCHTKEDQGKAVGPPFAGGFEFEFPNGMVVRSPNITMHETGIGAWSEQVFVNRFKSYTDSNYIPLEMKEGSVQTSMPWTMYSGMTEGDLKAIYAYLKTVPPVDNKVERYTVAK